MSAAGRIPCFGDGASLGVAMFLYLIRRILYAVPIALAVGFFCFMLSIHNEVFH